MGRDPHTMVHHPACFESVCMAQDSLTAQQSSPRDRTNPKSTSTLIVHLSTHYTSCSRVCRTVHCAVGLRIEMRALPTHQFPSARPAQPRRTVKCRSSSFTGLGVAPPSGGRHHFLHIDDFSTDELKQMLRNAARAKTAFYERDESFKPFAGQTMAMVFTKPSARTRISFETVSSLPAADAVDSQQKFP